MAASPRLDYVDNLRVFLTGLVISHHTAVTFSGAGLWYFMDPPQGESLGALVLTLFLAVNQSFFMSLFFFVSAFFVVGAFDRKGARVFLRDRLKRLGIPLLIFFFLLNPLVNYLVYRGSGEGQAGFLEYCSGRYGELVGWGPLWFVMTLLVMTVVYALLRVRAPEARAPSRPIPSHRSIFAFVILSGVAAFLLRIPFPVGTTIVGFQFGHYVLYIAFFVFGIWAYRSGWLESLSDEQSQFWWRTCGVVNLLVGGAIALTGAMNHGVDAFMGGLVWQAGAYAMWESFMCVGISMKLIVVFRRRFNGRNALTLRAAPSAYTAYIIHPFFVVAASFLVAGSGLDPMLKFLVVASLAIVACFFVSDFVRRAPLAREIL